MAIAPTPQEVAQQVRRTPKNQCVCCLTYA
jgi:hypothetical protein